MVWYVLILGTADLYKSDHACKPLAICRYVTGSKVTGWSDQAEGRAGLFNYCIPHIEPLLKWIIMKVFPTYSVYTELDSPQRSSLLIWHWVQNTVVAKETALSQRTGAQVVMHYKLVESTEWPAVLHTQTLSAEITHNFVNSTSKK